MTGDDDMAVLRQIVDDLAEDLHRSVVIDHPDLRVMYTSRHFGDEDAQRIRAILHREVSPSVAEHILGQGVLRWTKPGVVAGIDEIDMKSRFCVPLRRGPVLGFMFLIDDGPVLDPSSFQKVANAANRIGGLLLQKHIASDEARGRVERSVRNLLDREAANPEDVETVSEKESWPEGTGSAVVWAVGVRDGGLANDAGDTHRVTAGVRMWCSQKKGRLLAAPSALGGPTHLLQSWPAQPTEPQIRAAGVDLLQTLGWMGMARDRCVLGVSAPLHDLNRAYSARLQADVALKAAMSAEGENESIFPYPSLGPDGLLAMIGTFHPSPRDLVPAQLLKLRREDSSGRLIETLTVYLTLGCSLRRTAEALSLHRTSLYYRIGRIQSITGLSLDDGNDRLLLHIGLRLMRSHNVM